MKFTKAIPIFYHNTNTIIVMKQKIQPICCSIQYLCLYVIPCGYILL